MIIDDSNSGQNQASNPQPQSDTQQVTQTSQDQNQGKAISELVTTLQAVNPVSTEAQANATSITDNNGGRIELVDDPLKG